MLALEPLSSRKRTVTGPRGLTSAMVEDVEEERARGGEKPEERCGGDEADAEAERGGARANQGNSERVSDMPPMRQTPGQRWQSEEAPEVA